MNNNAAFKKRKEHRLAAWKASRTTGFLVDEYATSTASPEDNLSDLETLRKMVYPGLSDHRMNKHVAHLKKAPPSAARVHNK